MRFPAWPGRLDCSPGPLRRRGDRRAAGRRRFGL